MVALSTVLSSKNLQVSDLNSTLLCVVDELPNASFKSIRRIG